MIIQRWFIPATSVLALFLVSRVEAQNQEQVASETITSQTQPPEGANTLTSPARVRLRMTDGSRLTGDLLRAEEGRFILRTTDRISEERSIALTQVKRAEVSRGRQTRVRRGALVGFAIGVASTAVLGLICEDDWSPEGGESCTGLVGLGGVIFIPAGAIIGAGIGTRREDRWAEVPVSTLGAASTPAKVDSELAAPAPARQMGLAIAPTIDRGVQARFSISWR